MVSDSSPFIQANCRLGRFLDESENLEVSKGDKHHKDDGEEDGEEVEGVVEREEEVEVEASSSCCHVVIIAPGREVPTSLNAVKGGRYLSRQLR